jgi:hypothetical protein
MPESVQKSGTELTRLKFVALHTRTEMYTTASAVASALREQAKSAASRAAAAVDAPTAVSRKRLHGEESRTSLPFAQLSLAALRALARPTQRTPLTTSGAATTPDAWVHAFDVTGENKRRSDAAEAAFVAAARAHGFEAYKAWPDADRRYHIDFVCVALGDVERADAGLAMTSVEACAARAETFRALRVDVKALKSTASGDATQAEELWLELHGVLPKHSGWLFGGLADVIAVQRDGTRNAEAFEMLARESLAEFALRHQRSAQLRADRGMSSTADGALYKLYNRRGAELLMRVHLADAAGAASCGTWSVVEATCEGKEPDVLTSEAIP